MDIMIATQNEGKILEFQALFEPHRCIQNSIEVKETGLSFHENALLKARACAGDQFGLFVGDDSGIMLEVLSGMPGVHSKRWQGANNVSEAIVNVLKALEGKQGPFSAMMVCCLAVVTHKNDPLPMFFLGTMEGEFRVVPKGSDGFAYDKHFYVPSLGKTFAELTFLEKNKYSHRMQAVAKLKQALDQLENKEM